MLNRTIEYQFIIDTSEWPQKFYIEICNFITGVPAALCDRGKSFEKEDNELLTKKDVQWFKKFLLEKESDACMHSSEICQNPLEDFKSVGIFLGKKPPESIIELIKKSAFLYLQRYFPLVQIEGFRLRKIQTEIKEKTWKV